MTLKARMEMRRHIGLAKKMAKDGCAQASAVCLYAAYKMIAEESMDSIAVAKIGKQVNKWLNITDDAKGEVLWKMINLIQLVNGITPQKMEETA